MALNVPDGDGQAVFSHTIAGWSPLLVCTLGLGIADGETITTSHCNALFGVWSAALDSSVSSGLTFVGCTIYQKRPLGYVRSDSSSSSVVGTGGGSASPPNVAVMVDKVTERPGRSGTGRFFLPGVGESQIDPNGALLSAYRTQIATDLGLLRTNALALTWLDDLLLFHDDSNVSPDPTIIESFVADARISAIGKRFRRS